MTATVVNISTRRRQRENPLTGWVHVLRMCDGKLEVMHESRSGESWGPIKQFEPDELEQATVHAIGMLPTFHPSRLGKIALPLSLDLHGHQYDMPEGGAA